MTGPRIPTDDRAVSVQLSHVFGFAITGLLLVVVLTTAATFVADERADVARTQLETVGNELATTLQRVDRLAQRGSNATVRTTLPARVSGMAYAVAFEHGAECRSQNARSPNCLVLETVGSDVRTVVPVANETRVRVTEEGGGTVRVTAVGAGSGADEFDGHELVSDRPLRVGVAGDFEVPRFGSVTGPVNVPPVAEFDASPARPDATDAVTFNASESFDNDGTVVNYTWSFSSGPDLAGETVTRSFGPGRHNVTLTVEDDGNATANVTRQVRVSGLVRTSSFAPGQFASGDANETVNFTVENQWSDTVEVKQVTVDPADSSIDELAYCTGSPPWGCNGDHELHVDVGNDGVGVESRDMAYLGFAGDPLTIRETGLVYDLGEGDGLVVPAGDTARVSLGEFNQDMRGEEVTVGFRYEVDGQTYVSNFTGTVVIP